MTEIKKSAGSATNLLWLFLPLLLPAACTQKPMMVLAPQTYLDEEKKTASHCIVSFKAACNNGMGSLLTISNQSSTPVTVSQEMVILILADSLRIPAGKNFREFMYRRLKSAKKACDSVTDCISCRGEVTRYFMPFLSEHNFKFGAIDQNSRTDGAIAFDLLDPGNPSPEAQRISSALKSRANSTVPALVQVTIQSRNATETVTFPMQAKIIKNYSGTITGFLKLTRP